MKEKEIFQEIETDLIEVPQEITDQIKEIEINHVIEILVEIDRLIEIDHLIEIAGQLIEIGITARIER